MDYSRPKRHQEKWIAAKSAMEILLIELTMPYESRIDDAHVFKTEKYTNLAKEVQMAGFKTKIFVIVVVGRGFVASSTYSHLQKLSIS